MKIIIELEVEQRPFAGFNVDEREMIAHIMGRHLGESRSKNFGNIWGSPDLIARLTNLKVRPSGGEKLDKA